MLYEEFNRAISRNLRLLRRARGLSQSELADALGVSRSTYWAMENGDRPISFYHALTCCDVLDVPFSDLFDPDLESRLPHR